MVKPKPPVVRQKSIPAYVEPLEVPPVNPVQSGWNHKPLVEIENRIRRLKKSLKQIVPGDEKMVLAEFVEMLDLLIQLSSIDTDGLKALKVKKDCCLAELKQAKNDLTELIASDGNALSGPMQVLRSNSTAIDAADSDDDSSPIRNAQMDNPDDNAFIKTGVVNSMTKQFESDHDISASSTKSKSDTNITSNLNHVETTSDVECEPTECNNTRQISQHDLSSELAYYKDVVPSLDPEDFIKIESIKEHLQKLMISAESCNEIQEELAKLLEQIEVLCAAVPQIDENTSPISETSFEDASESNTSTLLDLQTRCQEFLRSEQAYVDVKCQKLPEIIDNDTDNRTGDNIQVLDINIPGNNRLTESMVMIETYKIKIQDYLKLPDIELLEKEGLIEENITAITNFSPHPIVAQQLEELLSSYKELLNFIMETKFLTIFNETIDDDSPNSEIPVNIDTFHALCAEIRNYYPHIERLPESSPAQIEVLKDNLLQVTEEIFNFDVSFSEELNITKEKALKELDSMLSKLM